MTFIIMHLNNNMVLNKSQFDFIKFTIIFFYFTLEMDSIILILIGSLS